MITGYSSKRPHNTWGIAGPTKRQDCRVQSRFESTLFSRCILVTARNEPNYDVVYFVSFVNGDGHATVFIAKHESKVQGA